MEHTKEYESPSSFWKWSAYTTVSAVLRDNCYFRQGDISAYPNLYTLLLAQSAEHRKGNPVRFCERLVGKVHNTKVISGRASIQAVLDELSRGETNPKTGKILAGGSALFSAPELSAGMVNDPEAIKILTDIYDFKDEYTHRLRGTGTFRIKNLCFTFFAASNEDLLRDVYDSAAKFGGLLGRTFVIKPSEFRPGNTLFNVEDKEPSFNELVYKLNEIASIRGEFSIEDDANKEYEKWYLPFRESYRNQSDKIGVLGRLHTGVLKLAMIFCIDQTRALSIKKCHIEEAIVECLGLLPNYNAFMMSAGKSTTSEVASFLLEDLYNAEYHQLPRREILRRYWNKFDAETLDKFVVTMEQAGMLRANQGTDGFCYQLTDKCLETLFKNQEENKK